VGSVHRSEGKLTEGISIRRGETIGS